MPSYAAGVRYLSASLLAVSASCSSGGPASPPTPPPLPRPRIVAHRGASHDLPENTLAAFRRAWELGVEGIELDVHTTRDGEVVVIHDPTGRRTTGADRPIAELTLAEVQALDAGAWKGPAFTGERIPTLAEALATVPRGRTVFVEIKTKVDTVDTIARAIRAADVPGRGGHVALQSFDPDALAAAALAVPGAAAYWTVDPPVDTTRPDQPRPLPYPAAMVDEAVARGFAGVALDYRAVDDALLGRLRAAGLLVDVWTVNDPATIATWAARDVRWIETDRPDLVSVAR